MTYILQILIVLSMITFDLEITNKHHEDDADKKNK